MKEYTHLINSGKAIVICWIASHVNIRGSERADGAAKSAQFSSVTNMKFQGRELTCRMSKFSFDEWQDIWNCCENNKVHLIYHTVGSVTHSKSISRRYGVVISRLQIGQSRLTHY